MNSCFRRSKQLEFREEFQKQWKFGQCFFTYRLTSNEVLVVVVVEEQLLHLHSHDLTRRFVDHFVDRTIGSSADFTQVSKIFSSKVTMLLWRDLQLP